MLTSADLLSPKGPIEPFLFPGEDSVGLAARLDQYLANGYADARVSVQSDDTLRDNLAQAWALYQAFTHVYTRMAANPLTVTVTDKGTSGYSAEQIRIMRDLAGKYLADFGALLVIAPAAVPSQLPGSRSVNITHVW